MASNEGLAIIKEEIVHPPAESTESVDKQTAESQPQDPIDDESVEELLARAEQMIAENQARMEEHQRSFEMLINMENPNMDETVRHTLARADEVIVLAQNLLDESSLDDFDGSPFFYINTNIISSGDDFHCNSGVPILFFLFTQKVCWKSVNYSNQHPT